jgi:hypothetical protein
MIEHGEIPTGKYETVYNFVQNLSSAKIVYPPAIPVHEKTIDVNSTPRKIIFAHAPSEITYSVDIEPGSSLAFAIGIMSGAWDKIPQGVKFDIEILSEGKTENIFSRVLQPKRNIGDRGWHNFIIPLEKFSGKSVSVIFHTTGSGDDLSYGWSAWGWGTIIKSYNLNENLHDETDEIFGKNPSDQENKKNKETRFGNRKAEIVLIELFDADGYSRRSYKTGEWASVKIHVLLHEDFKDNLVAGCVIKNKFFDIFGTNTKWEEINFGERKRGDTIIITFLQKLTINRGTYSVNVGIVLFKSNDDIEVLDRRYDCIFFNVTEDKNYSGIINLEHRVQFEVDTNKNR